MRRRRAQVREVILDPKYGDEIIARFINALMWKGKKACAQGVMYGALEKLEGKDGRSPKELFYEALTNVRPAIEIRSRRVGGATYPVPVQVRPERAQALGIRWMIQAARKRSEKTMLDRLAAELRDALALRGASVKRREDTHKMADANRAFSHYRW